MVGIAAIDTDADSARLIADVAIACGTNVAVVAAYPGKNDDPIADGNAFRLLAEGDDLALNLVAKGERQAAAARNIELIAAAKLEMSVVQVHIAVADTTIAHPYQRFPPFWRWRIRGVAGKWLAIGDDLFASHGCSPGWQYALRRIALSNDWRHSRRLVRFQPR